MAHTTNGAKAEANKGLVNMAEHSTTYQTKGKRRTRRTAKFSQRDALEILQQSFVMCHEAGIRLLVENSESGAVITLQSVEVLNGWLVPRVEHENAETVPQVGAE